MATINWRGLSLVRQNWLLQRSMKPPKSLRKWWTKATRWTFLPLSSFLLLMAALGSSHWWNSVQIRCTQHSPWRERYNSVGKRPGTYEPEGQWRRWQRRRHREFRSLWERGPDDGSYCHLKDSFSHDRVKNVALRVTRINTSQVTSAVRFISVVIIIKSRTISIAESCVWFTVIGKWAGQT